MLNSLIMQGRLVGDPVTRYTQSGNSVTTFRIACERDFADKNGNRGCDFIDVVAWKSLGEHVAKWFKKGDLILVDGRLQMSTYTDKEGRERTKAELLAEHTHFCGSKQKPTGSVTQGIGVSAADFAELDEDELPGELPF